MGGGMGGMGDMGGEMADMSSAFVTSANLTDSGPLAEWRKENQKKLEARAAESKKKLDAILAQAKSDRDAFYAQRTATIEATKATNRQQEQAKIDERNSAATKENLWESVGELVDMKAKADGPDISRMRQTILAM